MNGNVGTKFKPSDYDDELIPFTKCHLHDTSPTSYDSILPMVQKMPIHNYCDEECAASATSSTSSSYSSSNSCICLDCEFQEYQNATKQMMSHHTSNNSTTSTSSGSIITGTTISKSHTWSSHSDDMDIEQATQTPYSIMNLYKRIQMETSSTYDLFSLQEENDNPHPSIMMIHVPNTFAPAHWTVPLYRSFWWFATLQILQKDHAISIHIQNGSNLMYFSHFTNITMILTLLYQTFSTALSISSFIPYLRYRVLYQPTEQHSRPSKLVCWTWIMYTISLTSEVVVCLGYWLCEYGGPSSVPVKERSSNLYKHLMIGFLVYLDGGIIGRIPLRMKHLFHVVSYGALYTVYSIVFSYYQLGTEMGDIYRFIDWHNDPVDAMLYSVIFGLVAAPVIFMIFWIESSMPGCCYVTSHRTSKRRCTKISFVVNDIEIG